MLKILIDILTYTKKPKNITKIMDKCSLRRGDNIRVNGNKIVDNLVSLGLLRTVPLTGFTNKKMVGYRTTRKGLEFLLIHEEVWMRFE